MTVEFSNKLPAIREREVQKLSLKNLFINYFVNRGFIQLPILPLRSGDADSTVDFIGSSTNIYKDYLVDNKHGGKKDIPETGLLTFQPKLRTQNSATFYNDELINFNSYFTGGGILLPPDGFERGCELVTQFLFELGLKSDEILIKASSGHPDIVNYWKSNKHGIKLELDSEDPTEYVWKYGEENLDGRGFMFAVKSVGGNFIDFSTFTIINNSRGTVGSEWGFGSETFLSSRFGFIHPISYSSVSEIHNGSIVSVDSIKMSDAFMGSLAMLDSGLSYKPKDNMRGRSTLIKYLKAFSFYSREADITPTEIKEWVEHVNSKEFSSNPNTVDIFMDYVDTIRSREDQFRYAVNQALSGNLKPLESFEGVKRMVRSKSPIDLVALATKYFNQFEISKFYKQIKGKLDMDKFIKI